MTFNSGTRSATRSAPRAVPGERRGHDDPLWNNPRVNWALALSTLAAAPVVMLFALGGENSAHSCSRRGCPSFGRGGIDFNVAFYAAPLVAAFVILVSFITAKRRGGILVPLFGWAMLILDVALMAVTVSI